MPRTKVKVKDTLDEFLFKKIEDNPDYQLWAKDYKIPEYIVDNLHPSKTLRPYQEDALKHFIWLYENDRNSAKHLLFNMATGTGKTLVMASCVLYLYDKGYRNFIFLVHRDNILEQAKHNFTDYKFDKYLFNPKGVKMNGKKVSISEVDSPLKSNRQGINFIFTSQQTLVNRLTEERENSLTAEDFKKFKMIIIADEAHSLNADTRSKDKTLAKEARHWETSVISTLNMRPENMLLEFTATVDLANDKIHKKYEDKLVFRYDFLAFNKDGYSKDVKFLYNFETQIEDQKRLLIVNAVALSEFRRLLAERTMHTTINPIILVKSTRISESEKDRKFFDEVISTLRKEDLAELQRIAKTKNINHEHEIISDMFNWIGNKKNGLVQQGDWDGLQTFTSLIRANFAHDNTLIYNSQKKEKADLLPQLDDPKNKIRVIFSVNALNEGWDVLSLYDIIHFDISESKKVSLQDIQLIGRGARYCPYELPKEYRGDDGGIFARNLQFDKYRRKFDNDPNDTGRALETFVYHFVKTGTFLDTLRKDLLGEGIINEGVERKTITMKQRFLDSETYKKGFVLVNKTEKRKKTTNEDIDTTFKRIIKASTYNLRSGGLSDSEENQIIASQHTKEIQITEEYFSRPIIYKALMSSENDFFRFENLRHHLIGIKTIDELIDKYLPMYTIKYTYEDGKDISLLSAQEKLQLLVGVILPEVRKSIDLNMPRIIGSNKFRPVTLADIFAQEKSIYLTSFPTIDPVTGEKIFISTDERAKSQTEHDDPELQFDVKTADWYAYDENYGTSEEKKFVKWMATQIDNLYMDYPGSEIFVIRNELDYWLFGFDGRRFSPDYLLIINDVMNKKMYYQCLIEPKGGHILEQDKWKEDSLLMLNESSEVTFDEEDDDKQRYKDYLKEIKARGYQEIKNIGFKFFNTNPRTVEDFALDFEEKLYKKK